MSLILKGEEADTPNKFRPIALCDVIYKIISKVIVNHLKPLLPGLISLEQSSFVEGWQITNGIILVHELRPSIKIQKNMGMMVKMDIAKSYDKLN